jgi:DNA-binding NarL/FixJ family response regulator
VRGYVLKRSAVENLVQAIRAVMVGGLYIDPAIVGRVFDGNKSNRKLAAKKGVSPVLTDREADVLKMAALGFTNKEIASRLDVGVKSVETYKARGLEKVGLKTRAELVRYASGQGWLDF